MSTFMILALIAGLWFAANRSFEASGGMRHRVQRAALSWAFIGGAAGSFFGVAGFGAAISGLIPGAVLGYTLAWALMSRRTLRAERAPESAQPPPRPRWLPACIGAAVGAFALSGIGIVGFGAGMNGAYLGAVVGGVLSLLFFQPRAPGHAPQVDASLARRWGDRAGNVGAFFLKGSVYVVAAAAGGGSDPLLDQRTGIAEPGAGIADIPCGTTRAGDERAASVAARRIRSGGRRA